MTSKIKSLFILIMASATISFAYANMHVYHIDDGDIRPLIAVAAKNGRAYGVYTGKMAETIRHKTGKNGVLEAYAERIGEEKEPGCVRVKVTFNYTYNSSPLKAYPSESLEVKTCKKGS